MTESNNATRAPLHQEVRDIASLRKWYTSQGNGDWWFIQDAVLSVVSETLKRQNWVYMENFLTFEHARLLLSDHKRLMQSGAFKSGYLAGDNLGGGVRYSHKTVRGDEVHWSNGVDTEDPSFHWSPYGNPALRFEKGLNSLTLFMKKMDTFIAQLGEQPATERELGNAADRSHAMMAHYPPGGAYVRHCDNHCKEGQGDDCNGRRATAIIYLNDGWKEAHGGELLLYKPPPDHNDTLCRVAPKLGSVIIFWSDFRVPHEVLPAVRDRFAITTWYNDGAERARMAQRAKSRPDDFAEKQRLKAETEIREMEEKFGSKAEEVAQGSYKGSEYTVTNNGILSSSPTPTHGDMEGGNALDFPTETEKDGGNNGYSAAQKRNKKKKKKKKKSNQLASLGTEDVADIGDDLNLSPDATINDDMAANVCEAQKDKSPPNDTLAERPSTTDSSIALGLKHGTGVAGKAALINCEDQEGKTDKNIIQVEGGQTAEKQKPERFYESKEIQNTVTADDGILSGTKKKKKKKKKIKKSENPLDLVEDDEEPWLQQNQAAVLQGFKEEVEKEMKEARLSTPMSHKTKRGKESGSFEKAESLEANYPQSDEGGFRLVTLADGTTEYVFS